MASRRWLTGGVVAIAAAIAALAFVAGGSGGQVSAGAGPEAPAGAAAPPAGQFAAYYLPVYARGAGYAGESDDRLADARRSMNDWKEIAELGGIVKDGPQIGSRQVDTSSITSGVEVSSADIEQVEREVAEELGDPTVVPSLEPGAEPLTVVLPIYNELADVCGRPASVVLFAQNQRGQTVSVIDQYDAKPLDAAALPRGVQRAWSYNYGDATGYIWSSAAVPELLQLVTVSSSNGCALGNVTEQVSIRRG